MRAERDTQDLGPRSQNPSNDYRKVHEGFAREPHWFAPRDRALHLLANRTGAEAVVAVRLLDGDGHSARASQISK